MTGTRASRRPSSAPRRRRVSRPADSARRARTVGGARSTPARPGVPEPVRGPAALGLPRGIRACLFDLDGVLTRTASLHAIAWKRTFDGFLRRRAARTGGSFRPFDPVRDYDEYLDGKPRSEGVRSFLAARGIALPEGGSHDPAGSESVTGLGDRKNRLVRELIRRRGVRVYEGSVRYVRAARSEGLRCAVVSSSTNCRAVLAAAGIQRLFHVTIDGRVARREHLAGKPAPATYLAAAARLSVPPEEGAVFEDSLAGVEAGRAGRFGCVVGIDRSGQRAALRRHGADRVVRDLSELGGSP